MKSGIRSLIQHLVSNPDAINDGLMQQLDDMLQEEKACIEFAESKRAISSKSALQPVTGTEETMSTITKLDFEASSAKLGDTKVKRVGGETLHDSAAKIDNEVRLRMVRSGRTYSQEYAQLKQEVCFS